jgi:Predicted sugar kinase
LKNTNELHTLIIDASALTIIAKEKINLKDLHVNLILTPHQGEWERLSGLEINQQIPENNLTALNNLAPQSILIVKKHLSDIYYQGKVSQLSNGNPGMATGGMGDTLTGIIAGFVAQFGFL